jgi:hypothetical protein
MKIHKTVLLMFLADVAALTFCQTTASSGNLQTCLSGKYPALCDHNTLSSEQAKQVRAAENRENLQLCMIGKYPALCDHSRLTSDQAVSVKQAERLENLTVCSSGHYPGLCNHALLTSEQAKAVAAAEAKVAPSRTNSPTARAPLRKRQPGGCVSGLFIESVEGDGKVIKLDDGSMWEVDDVDTVDTALWLATEDVVLCDGKIINTEEKESADVTPIRRGASGYTIDASANDETFVINGEIFKAKTYCFNFDKGDHVKFIEGSPLGACAAATILNLRSGEVCEVWCGD